MSTATYTSTMSNQRRPSASSSAFQVIFERPDQPAPSPPPGEPAFRPRRYHTKSRNGCFNCKRRRIKCDEAEPECNHCWEKDLRCEYPATKSSPQPQLSSLPSPPRRSSSSRQASEESPWSDPRVASILNEDDVPAAAVAQRGYHRSDVFEVLRHFVSPTDHVWIGSPCSQGIVQEHVRRNAATAPYLLHSALAFSAAHMQYLNPTVNKYRVAAPYHYQHSLRRYFDKLSETLKGDDAGSLLVSCELHAFLAFMNAGSGHNGRPGVDLGWVRSMRGMQFIMQSPHLMSSLERSAFHPILRKNAHSWQRICEQEQRDTSTRVADDLRQLRALEHLIITYAHSDHQPVLSHSLSMLRDLAHIRPQPAAIGAFTIWINRQSSELIDLLQLEEPLALLMLGMWCVMFGRIDEWWIVGSARSEVRKICEQVERIGDGRLGSVVGYLRSSCR